MATLNLQRNSEIFFSTVDLLNGNSPVTMTPSNTWKIEVLAGFAATAMASTQNLSYNRLGEDTERSSRTFVTDVQPVDWNFQNYIRPTGADKAATPNSGLDSTTPTGNAKPVADWFLWQSLISNTAPSINNVESSVWVSYTGITTANVPSSLGAAASRSSHTKSTQNYLYFKLDNIVYQVSNVVVDTATIDAGIQEIATTTWSGKGVNLVELQKSTRDNAISVFGGILNSGSTVSANSNSYVLTAASSYHPFNTMNIASVITTHPYIKNRLSAIEFSHTYNNVSNTYTFPVTNFSVTYTNTTQYLPTTQLSKVSNPSQAFNANRDISGSISMYLRSGNNDTAQFVKNLTDTNTFTTSPYASAKIYIGGLTAPYMYLSMPSVQIDFPQISVTDIASVSAAFRAQESSFGKADELAILVSKNGIPPSIISSGYWIDSQFWDDIALWNDSSLVLTSSDTYSINSLSPGLVLDFN